jgi:hypothetical protein
MVAADGELIEEASGRKSACLEVSVGDSGSWSMATEEEEAVIPWVGSMEEEELRQRCSPVNGGNSREQSRGSRVA